MSLTTGMGIAALPRLSPTSHDWNGIAARPLIGMGIAALPLTGIALEIDQCAV